MTKKLQIWKQVVYKAGIWLIAEIWLNLIGLDNMADYTEFIFDQDLDSNLKNRRTVKINEYTPIFCPEIGDFCPIPRTLAKLTDIEEDTYTGKAKIFKNKCQQLAKPCVKIICLESVDSSITIN